MISRKTWTKEEDGLLMLIYEEKGIKKWSQISKTLEKEFQIKGRTGKQCRQRFHNHLNRGIKREQWTNEEESNLIALHCQFGNKWATISRLLEGRTDNSVKNKFYSIVRRGLKKLNRLIRQCFWRFNEVKIELLYRAIQLADQLYKGYPTDPVASQIGREIKQMILQLAGQHLQNQQNFDLKLVQKQKGALLLKKIKQFKQLLANSQKNYQQQEQEQELEFQPHAQEIGTKAKSQKEIIAQQHSKQIQMIISVPSHPQIQHFSSIKSLGFDDFQFENENELSWVEQSNQRFFSNFSLNYAQSPYFGQLHTSFTMMANQFYENLGSEI